LTGAALEAVKAGIFLGDPHYRAGLPYNVGTCTAQGVSKIVKRSELGLTRNSSLLAPLASSARLPSLIGSSPTVTPLIPTAALAMTKTLTSSMSTSTALRLWPSSSRRSLRKWRIRLRPTRVTAVRNSNVSSFTFVNSKNLLCNTKTSICVLTLILSFP
jgi:hypothetical protein